MYLFTDQQINTNPARTLRTSSTIPEKKMGCLFACFVFVFVCLFFLHSKLTLSRKRKGNQKLFEITVQES